MSFRFKKKPAWQVAAATDVGTVRSINQDNFYVMEKVQNHTSLLQYRTFKECEGVLLLAVCDGIGGESRGEEAAFLASRVLEGVKLKRYISLSTAELEAEVTRLIRQMSEAVYRKLGSDGTVAGSTTVLLYADGLRTVVANVGDSVGIRFHTNGAQLVTVSDNYANILYEQGEITEKERWEHASKRQLTQYLGENPEEFLLQPHIYLADAMEPGEKYYLLSDGIVDGVKVPQIVELAGKNPYPIAAFDLVEAAKNGGSRDNLTAVVVQRKV